MFPELVPTPPTDPTGRPAMAEAENNAAAWAVYQKWTKPVLLAFSDEDTVMAGHRRQAPGLRMGHGGRPHAVPQLCVSGRCNRRASARAVWVQCAMHFHFSHLASSSPGSIPPPVSRDDAVEAMRCR